MKAFSMTQRKFFTQTVAAAALLVTCSTAFAGPSPALTDEQKTIYAVGVSLARSLDVFDFSTSEFEIVKQGLTDAQSGKANDLDISQINQKIQELAKARRKAAGERQVGAGNEFLEKAAKEKGAVKTASGMVYRSLAEGAGTSPTATDLVKVNYRGTLVDGKEFDSTYKRGKPLEFRLDNVIKCWVEGLQMMKPGGKAKLVCPPNLAYGDAGAGEILPGATLAFEVELLDAKPSPALPATPAKK